MTIFEDERTVFNGDATAEIQLRPINRLELKTLKDELTDNGYVEKDHYSINNGDDILTIHIRDLYNDELFYNIISPYIVNEYDWNDESYVDEEEYY